MKFTYLVYKQVNGIRQLAAVTQEEWDSIHRQIRSSAAALCGLYQVPLDTYLRENSHLRRIVLCLDADRPGWEAAEKFQTEYPVLEF